MKDKVTLLMEETGCDRSEAELALQLCGYDLEDAVQAVPRLFQNISVFKGRFCVRRESLYGLWLAILDLKERRLLRARAVISYNPAVFASDIEKHWFDFEGRLYACRLWAGTLQKLSQEVEGLLASLFDSSQARPLYEEGADLGDEDFAPLKAVLAKRLGGEVRLQVRQDVLDMGQFREVRPPKEEARPARAPRRSARAAKGAPPPGGILVLKVALEPDAGGVAAGELKAGDLVQVSINDQRDIARYLARLFGAKSEKGTAPLPVPVEAVEKGGDQVTIRVRFSAGVCGDVAVPGDIRIKVARRSGRTPWWKKMFGG